MLLDTATAVATAAAETLAHTQSPAAPAAAAVAEVGATRAPRRKKRGKDPEVLVEGDLLVNTPKMIGLVWSSLALNAAYLLQVNGSGARRDGRLDL